MRYSMETMFVIWNDDTGERFEVGDDADGLGMMAITFVTDDGKRSEASVYPAEQVPLLIEAMSRWLKEREEAAQ